MARPRVALIGAGSTVFARAILRDILLQPELRDVEIRLMDIDERRLRTTQLVAKALARNIRANMHLIATTDQRRALDGADYVITMFQVGGYRPGTTTDFEIPTRYGLWQTIGDTLGIGGIMRGLRSIPVLLAVAHDMEELCPGALLLNYTNPMAMLVWSVLASSTTPVVGLCHSVQGTAAELAGLLGIPRDELHYLVAGINHMAFFLRFEHQGTDLYPRLREFMDSGLAPAYERVRFDVLKRWGYFVTESSEHFAEYVPWYIKRDRPDLIDELNIPLDEYPARCEDQIAEWDRLETALLSSAPDGASRQMDEQPIPLSGAAERRLAAVARTDPEGASLLRERWVSEWAERRVGPSGEYAAEIIAAMETGKPTVIYGNVRNNSLIDNLPDGCCVEVPCLVDANGIQPTRIGSLPPQLAALIRTNVGVQELTVQAALTGNRQFVYQAAMLDPHTAAELDPASIAALVDELIAAHGELIPTFCC
jgi:alpha-galactosidase